MTTIGVGVIGMGFMGQTHARCVASLAAQGVACRLVAVNTRGAATWDDIRAGRRSGNIPAHQTQWPEHPAPEVTADTLSLLINDAIDLVVIATTTPSHVRLAIEALEAGKHVLVEKPVALSANAIEPLARIARARPELRCMPAHVMRFWPGWDTLARWISSEAFGRLLSASFQRLGTVPHWNRAFYDDISASGGALCDLHIHDVDFIIHCLGQPARIHAHGDHLHVMTSYSFDTTDALITAEASWRRQPAGGFQMRFTADFEHATAEFDLARSDPLLLHEGERTSAVPTAARDPYEAQLHVLIDSIATGQATPVSIDDALKVARVIDRERAQLNAQAELTQ
ncbi:MAG: oxidoreductase [Phycisphaerales bacterium]